MITSPPAHDLVRIVAHHLRTTVLPACSDDVAVRASLEVAISILETAATDTEHNLRWLSEEIESIQDVADAVLAALPSSNAPAVDDLTARLRQSVAAAGSWRDPVDPAATRVLDSYILASEILSCLGELEAAISDQSVRRRIGDLFDQRMAHETQCIGGEFRAVGRG